MAKRITINSISLPYPKTFELQRVPNIVCELQTMAGNRIADVNGWRYADTEIKWDVLYPEDLKRLVNAVRNTATFNIVFDDVDGTTKTVSAILKGFTSDRTLAQVHGNYVWENVGITVMFPTCYQY